jgi:hypothetical protein
MRRNAILALLAMAGHASGQAVATPAGTGSAVVTGTVLDEKGRPIGGAIVSLAAELPRAVRGQARAPFTPFRAIALTAKDGTFSQGNLPAGLIKVCVQVPNSDYIEECRWPLTPTLVTLAEGQQVTLPPISKKKGFRMKIRVDDPAGSIQRTGEAAEWPALNLGVFTENRLFVSARRVGSDSAGLNYEVLVPFDVPLHVSASSRTLALSDGNGRAGAQGKGVVTAVTVAGGTGSMGAVRFVVNGGKP